MSAPQNYQRKGSRPASKNASPEMQPDQPVNARRRASNPNSNQRPVRPSLEERSTSFRSSASTSMAPTAGSSQPSDCRKYRRQLSTDSASTAPSVESSRPPSSVSRRSSQTSRPTASASRTQHTHDTRGLSCNDHKHACLPCAQNVAAAYYASKHAAATGSAKANRAFSPEAVKGLFGESSQGRRQTPAASAASRTTSAAAQKGGQYAVDACAICGVALGLSLTATDYVCVLAGGALGVLFVPFGVLFEYLSGMMNPVGRFNLSQGVLMPLKICGGGIGTLGKLIPPSFIGLIIGGTATERLLDSKWISKRTASAIQALHFPGLAILNSS